MQNDALFYMHTNGTSLLSAANQRHLWPTCTIGCATRLNVIPAPYHFQSCDLELKWKTLESTLDMRSYVWQVLWFCHVMSLEVKVLRSMLERGKQSTMHFHSAKSNDITDIL
ncbi:hypothetical protein H5410_033659 [Solanum commersonii]|uniref:Uncharacterized protein n=1 Tax=Solanum commersonii TaxID=4109 RepID=A0A9J5YPA6_SOLCO|nr:hypothetical protein H5410_033659 [Solanum commersonii]